MRVFRREIVVYILGIIAGVFVLELAAEFLIEPVLPPAGKVGAAVVQGTLLSLLIVPLVVRALVRQRAVSEQTSEATLLRAAVEQLPVTVILTDASGRIQYVNPAFTRITGYTPEEALGSTPRLLKSGEQDEAFYQKLWASILAGREWRGEVVNRRKNGTRYVQELVVQPVRDDGGQVAQIIGIGQDVTERRQAEEELAEREAQFRALSDQSLTGIALIQDGRFVYVNPRITEMFGYTPAEMIGLTTVDVVHEDDRAMMRESLRQRLTGEVESVHHFFKGLRKDGTCCDVELFGRSLVYRGRRAALSTLLDITDRTRADATLRAQEKRFRSLIENSAEGIGLISGDTSAIYLSPAFEQMVHFPVEEWLGRPVFELVHPADLGLAQTMLEEGLRRPGVPIPWQFRFRDASGAWRWMEGTAVNLIDDAAVQGIVVNWSDVTERKQAEEALSASERRARTLFDTVDLIVLGLDSQGRVDYVNPFFLRITGYTREEVLGEPWVERFLPRAQRAEMRRVLLELQEHDLHPHYQYPIVTRAGQERLINWNNTVVRDPEGRPIGTLSIGEDITEHRLMEAQFRQVQKMEAVGRLTGSIAHDFNNILMAIIGYTDFLLAAIKSAPALVEDVQEIRKAADRAVVLTRQLLAFSRRQVLVPQLLDLNALITDLGKMLKRLITENVSLGTHLADNLGTVRADPGQLEQVIMNLVINARDAMPDGGNIDIGTANVDLDESYVATHPYVRAGRYVSFSVSDSGFGMSAEVLSHLFEPFLTTKKAGEGTGLGLATVYGIVKQSGGHITVYSEPNEGTTFKVYLPRVDESPQPIGVTELPAPAVGHETILVVDDDDSVRGLVQRVLGDHGYTVLGASGPAIALRLAREHAGHIHLLVTDVVMAGGTGRELADELTDVLPGLKVLYMSGYSHDAIVHRGVLDPGLHFLTKPVSPDVLLGTVRNLLDGPADERS